MPNFFDRLKDAAQGIKVAADATVYAGHIASRYINNARHGTCLVCNNLQPSGHENTFGRVGARVFQNDPALAARQKEIGVVPTLVLEDLSTKKLLECREADPATGALKNDCKYCRLLCAVFDHFFIDEWMSWITETKNGMPIKFGLMIQEGAPLIINCWEFEYDKWFKTCRCDIELYMDPMPQFLPPGTPAMGPVNARCEDTSAEACTLFLKDSVKQCCAEHPQCAQNTGNFVPTRLVFIGPDDDSLRLHETSALDHGTPWVALSHCWGKGKPLSLTTEELRNFKETIPYSSLPNTFRDAIQVTRELGLSHIWIDSLCIIQNDLADWQKEAALMESVYRDAFIVVSSSSSPNPETPFLGPRQQDWLPKQFDLPAGQGVVLPIMARKRSLLAAPLEQGLYEPPFTESWATLKRVGPLYSRGWCFQESHLATRILHFTPGAVIFECQAHRRREDQLPPYTITEPGTLGEISTAQQWRSIVKSYTGRQLTRATDRLPAISGAAMAMPQARTSRYLAGLWSETLLLDLLWHIMPYGEYENLAYSEDENQHAPTWSWASMKWGVTWSPLVNPELVATVLDVQVVVDGLNPYGQVSSGSVTIRGFTKPCILTSNYHQKEHWISYPMANGTLSPKLHFRTDGVLSQEPLPGRAGTIARRKRDGPSKNEITTSAIILFIVRTGAMSRTYTGLVLGLSPLVPGRLERVGLIWKVPSDCFDSSIETTVTIV